MHPQTPISFRILTSPDGAVEKAKTLTKDQDGKINEGKKETRQKKRKIIIYNIRRKKNRESLGTLPEVSYDDFYVMMYIVFCSGF